MLKEVANVDCSYNMTPEELYAKVAESDALIVRSATKVRNASCNCYETADQQQQCLQVINVPGCGVAGDQAGV